MKSMKVMVCLSVVMLLLSGCNRAAEQNVGKPESKQSSLNEGNFTKEYSENLHVDLQEMPITSVENLQRYQIGIFNPELTLIQQVVFPEDTGSPELYSPEKDVEQLATQNGLLITKAWESLNAHTKEWDTYSDFIGFRDADSVKTDEPLDVELSFLSRKDAKDKVQSIVETLYQTFTVSEVRVEAYTKEHMQKLVDNIAKDASFNGFIKSETIEHTWTEEEEIYCLTVSFTENDISILNRDINLRDGSTVWGSRVEIWMNKRGIQRLQAVGLWMKETEERTEVCSLEEALHALAGKYRNIVSDDQMTVTEAQLVYVPLAGGIRGERYLTPVWILRGQTAVQMESKDKGGQIVHMLQEAYVNGETGRLIE